MSGQRRSAGRTEPVEPDIWATYAARFVNGPVPAANGESRFPRKTVGPCLVDQAIRAKTASFDLTLTRIQRHDATVENTRGRCPSTKHLGKNGVTIQGTRHATDRITAAVFAETRWPRERFTVAH